MENLSPDFQAMMGAHPSGVVRGVIVTLQGTESNGCVDSCGTMYDFVSRYFAPWVGISEDPVTGEWKALFTLHQTEKFETGVFTLKTHQLFSVITEDSLRRRNLKTQQMQSSVNSFWICVGTVVRQ